MLKLININKTYDNKVKALKNINLELDKNELAVIIGPSGCGKTTLLRTIAGLEKQDTGDILIQDKLVNDLAPYMRDISFVFQDASLFAHMNVFDNIAYGNHGNMDKKQLRQKVEKISKILKIEDLLTRYPSKLSGGQRQRVAIARAICKSSKLILMDEPFSNVDAQLKEDLIQEIKMLQKELDLMIIYVTHDQKEAFALADKLIVMEDGHILQIDKPSNVYRHPINPFVARFFGDINIFEGNIEDVVSPKRLKRDASFAFVPVLYKDAKTGQVSQIKRHFKGKYSFLSDVSVGSLAKQGAVFAGNKLLDGFFGPGVAVVEGAVKNEHGNRAKSAAISLYESTPLSYANKGEDINIPKGTVFVMSFKTAKEAAAEAKTQAPNYTYTMPEDDTKE